MNKFFFFILWGDPKFYQTLIFLAKHLSKNGYKIFIICKINKKIKIIENVNFGQNIKLYSPINSKFFFSNFFDYLFFNVYVFYKCLKEKPKNTIFFNQKSLLILLIIQLFRTKKQKFYYHNFDFDLPKNFKKIKDRLLFNLEIYATSFCNGLIFPSKKRSEIFAKITKNKKVKIHYLMNCFPLNYKPKINFQFKRFLRKKKLLKKKIVCRLGSIGPDHYVEELIDSFKYLDSNFILILAGVSNDNYATTLKKKIIKLNLAKNVFIFENIKNNFWFDILLNSHLGICFYKDVSISHRNMAGTSQKFNNYLLANIPMITNNNSDFQNFKKYYDVYETVNPGRSREIAKKIEYMFRNNSRINQIKKNMKSAFKNELNFEKQFNSSYAKLLF